jgi:hypothetical protein
MSVSFLQAFTASERRADDSRLDRAIARADLIADCRRGVLPLLSALGRDSDSARRALEDAEARADALRRLRDLLIASRSRRGKSS